MVNKKELIMGITYEVLHEVNIEVLRELCNDLIRK